MAIQYALKNEVAGADIPMYLTEHGTYSYKLENARLFTKDSEDLAFHLQRTKLDGQPFWEKITVMLETPLFTYEQMLDFCKVNYKHINEEDSE